jgi:MurNAc alpha-1-phosphate uridylyltransferase
MTQQIDTLMIFAAGFGKRMKHVTQTLPKPLVRIHKKPMLYYVLESALRHRFKHIFVNTHYLHEQIEDAVKHFQNSRIDCPKITLLHEPELLETGGTIKNGLQYFDSDAIITHNSDIVLHSDQDFFMQLKQSWNPEIMNFLLLVHETQKAVGYVGNGDFELSPQMQLTKPQNLDFYPYMYTGVAILKPSLVASNPQTIFSLQEYYNNPDHMYGQIHSGDWYHVSSPEDIIATERRLQPF